MALGSINQRLLQNHFSEAAFEELFHEYHQKLYFYFLKKTGSVFLSEELVQLTFIKLWKHQEKLSEEVPISSQIFRIARTTLIDALRKEAVERDALQHIQRDKKDHTVQNTVFETYLHEEINTAINKLPPVRKKVFQLSRLQGLSYQEIAKKLSISTKTVEDHITKATRHLKTILKYELPVVLVLFMPNLMYYLP